MSHAGEQHAFVPRREVLRAAEDAARKIGQDALGQVLGAARAAGASSPEQVWALIHGTACLAGWALALWRGMLAEHIDPQFLAEAERDGAEAISELAGDSIESYRAVYRAILARHAERREDGRPRRLSTEEVADRLHDAAPAYGDTEGGAGS